TMRVRGARTVNAVGYNGASAAQGICKKYNNGKCNNARCKEQHLCNNCKGKHRAVECPNGSTVVPQKKWC
ncbi:hypothetical protein HDZ31DRAFT_14849, partial [Schizophyllum fasciatum]